MSWFKSSERAKGNVEVDLYYKCPVPGCTLGMDSSFIMERDREKVSRHQRMHDDERARSREIAKFAKASVQANSYRVDVIESRSKLGISLAFLTSATALLSVSLHPINPGQLLAVCLGFAAVIAESLAAHRRARRLAAFGAWVTSAERTSSEVQAVRSALRGGHFLG